VVESVHSLHASLTIDTRQPWKRRPNIETDSYVIIAAATPWSEIVQTALQRLGYSQEVANTARGGFASFLPLIRGFSDRDSFKIRRDIRF